MAKHVYFAPIYFITYVRAVGSPLNGDESFDFTLEYENTNKDRNYLAISYGVDMLLMTFRIQYVRLRTIYAQSGHLT